MYSWWILLVVVVAAGAAVVAAGVVVVVVVVVAVAAAAAAGAVVVEMGWIYDEQRWQMFVDSFVALHPHHHEHLPHCSASSEHRNSCVGASAFAVNTLYLTLLSSKLTKSYFIIQ